MYNENMSVKNETVKKVFILSGLDCTVCASKIEREVNNIDGVKSASINFVTKKLALQVHNKKDLNSVIHKVTGIVNRIESDVKIIEVSDKTIKDDTQTQIKKTKYILSCIGVVLFIIALVFKLDWRLEMTLFIASYLSVGYTVLFKAIKNIIKGQIFDENFLMAIATLGAFAIREYPEAIAVMVFYQLGEFLQSLAVNKSRKSIADLMDIRPDYANIERDGVIKKVHPDEISLGDIIIVKPGEKVPLDGTVIEGKSTLDTSALTGESMPFEVEEGKAILSGSINLNKLLRVKVTKNFSESTVSKILDLVQNAGEKKAETENFITKFARYYTPIVVIFALVLGFVPPLIIQDTTFSEWINRALIFLVVSCPCALVISIPLSFFGGIGAASRKGILVKGSNYLEALNNVEMVVFDKTGTLTRGVFSVTEIVPYAKITKQKLLEYAAYAESYSNHPIAVSIRSAYGKEINKKDIKNYNEIAGYGISVDVGEKKILVGNGNFMLDNNIHCDNINTIGTVIHVAVDGTYYGYIIISDEIKKDSKKAVTELRVLGIEKILMLTGDSKTVGDKIGRELMIDEVYSELLPHQKVEKVEELNNRKTTKGKLAFVGDGINDAPVLARADVGIAMGGLGSDVAIEAADIVLMTDEPSKIAEALRIAKKTRRIVWFNIILAMSVKGIVLLLGALGVATMWEAVFADVGVTLLAVLNSLRIIKSNNK